MEKSVRLSARVTPEIAADVKKAADAKRWSLSVFIEEALISYLAEK